MWQFVFALKPRRDPPTGSTWRKHNETMTWELVKLDDTEAVLSGPGPCRGLLRVPREELLSSKHWSRV